MARPRSHSFIAEVDDADPFRVKEPTVESRRDSADGPGLSQKTYDLVTNLDHVASPVAKHSKSPTCTEEEREERKLREQELEAIALSASKKRKQKDPLGKKDYDAFVKILMLGDGGVGKTSLICRFADNKFSSSLLSTAGVDYKIKHFNIKGKRVRCQIWDTAGQERFRVITRAYYKLAHGIMLVYDTSDQLSFKSIRHWMKNIQDESCKDVEKILIGNKIDLKDTKVIDSAQAQGIADEFDCQLFETSAKTGQCVEKAFKQLVRNIVERQVATDAVPVACEAVVDPLERQGKKGQKGDGNCSLV